MRVFNYITMKKLILIVSLAFINMIANAQNTYIIGDKSYKTTPEFKLHQISDGILGYQMKSNPVKIAFGMQGQGAILIISKTAYDYQSKFKGKLLIYLDDDTVITCLDKGFNDRVNSLTSKVYFLTPSELGKLKESNINGIRYSFEEVSGFTTDYIVYNVEYTDGIDLLSTDMNKSRDYPKTNFPHEIRKLNP